MSYESTTIAKIINKLNKNYFLPAIQRPYVWKPEQLIRLFDSLMKGYPISSFLFWDLKPENKQQWEIYKFVENFRFGETHNEIAETDGLDVTLVLDGQQRLTSLMLGLRGSYTVKSKHKKANNPDAWTRQHLYLDLLKDPNLNDDEVSIEISYGFHFFSEKPTNSQNHFWIKVGQILECNDESQFYELKDKLSDLLNENVVTNVQIRLFERNLDRLYRMVWKDESVAYFTEQSQSYDRVLDIFIRANDGGTKLSKSDLLLSMLTSKWDGANAREEIFNFVEYVNNGLTLKNDFDKDFVMKACLVLSDLPHAYKVENFTKENLEVIKNNWAKIKKTLEQTILLANSFGLDRDLATSTNALHPVAYYLYKSSKSLQGTTISDASNAKQIHRWLLISLLNGTFNGFPDRTISLSRTILKEHLEKSLDFPADNMLLGLRTLGSYSSFGDDFIDHILQITYGKKTAFLALSLIQGETVIGNNRPDIDHFFPKKWFETANLQNAGVSVSQISVYQEYANNIANLQILLLEENREKSDKSPEEWMKNRDDDFKRKHCIPNNPEFYKLENFLQFVTERKKLMEIKLKSIFSHSNQFSTLE